MVYVRGRGSGRFEVQGGEAPVPLMVRVDAADAESFKLAAQRLADHLTTITEQHRAWCQENGLPRGLLPEQSLFWFAENSDNAEAVLDELFLEMGLAGSVPFSSIRRPRDVNEGQAD
jgi:hypothetical protein